MHKLVFAVISFVLMLMGAMFVVFDAVSLLGNGEWALGIMILAFQSIVVGAAVTGLVMLAVRGDARADQWSIVWLPIAVALGMLALTFWLLAVVFPDGVATFTGVTERLHLGLVGAVLTALTVYSARQVVLVPRGASRTVSDTTEMDDAERMVALQAAHEDDTEEIPVIE